MGMRLCVARLECVLGIRLCVVQLECVLVLRVYGQACMQLYTIRFSFSNTKSSSNSEGVLVFQGTEI